jgi:hypothetical protein
MLLCEYVFMRTTIELPDAVFRRLKATAALQGSTIKEFVQRAVERELGSVSPERRRVGKLPLIKGAGHMIKPLSGEEMDELLFG